MQCEIILKQCHRMVTTCIYFSNLVKVIVQPKMKKKKISYHLVPTLNYFHPLNLKEDILKNVCNQTVLVPIDFHCIDK